MFVMPNKSVVSVFPALALSAFADTAKTSVCVVFRMCRMPKTSCSKSSFFAALRRLSCSEHVWVGWLGGWLGCCYVLLLLLLLLLLVVVVAWLWSSSSVVHPLVTGNAGAGNGAGPGAR